MHKLNKIQTVFAPESGAKLLTVKDAAKYLKYDPVSIRRLVGRGDLQPHSRVGNSLLFLQEELERFRCASLWAQKKTKLRYLPNPPPLPTTDSELQAVVTVDVKQKTVIFKRLNVFHWEDISAIRAQVDAKYGKKPFQITVKVPDGCGYEIRFYSSVMEVEHYDKLPGHKKSGGAAWLVG